MPFPVFVDYLDYLDRETPSTVLPWACPVPYFGSASAASVVTVGINPSNLEFTDSHGRELEGQARRLPTLRSLGIESWADADSRHIVQLVTGCNHYFKVRPYNRWFGVLERVLNTINHTYYGDRPSACHIDLVAFATRDKWSSLSTHQRNSLLRDTRRGFAELMELIPAQILVLNGTSVVRSFEASAGITLDSRRVKSWDLRRPNGVIPGIAYVGLIHEFAGIPLSRRLMVAGYNHNLQSSFGVTSGVIEGVSRWLEMLLRESL